MRSIVCVILFVALGAANPLDVKHNRRRSFQDLVKRGFFDCIQLDEECSGIPSCCGDSQCYFPHGYRPFRTGYCVTCVQQHQHCQYDKNCCEGLQCDKTGDFKTNGLCQPPRALGEQCWEDSQCDSRHCSDSFFHPSGQCV